MSVSVTILRFLLLEVECSLADWRDEKAGPPTLERSTANVVVVGGSPGDMVEQSQSHRSRETGTV